MFLINCNGIKTCREMFRQSIVSRVNSKSWCDTSTLHLSRNREIMTFNLSRNKEIMIFKVLKSCMIRVR